MNTLTQEYLNKTFHGTKEYYKSPLNPVLLVTEGVKYFFDTTDSGILIPSLYTLVCDYAEGSLAYIKFESKPKSLKITVTNGDAGDGRGEVIFSKLKLCHRNTDIPEGNWKMYYHVYSGVLMLPSEH